MQIDPRSMKNIKTLHPVVQEKAIEYLTACKDAMLPYEVKIICGTRTYAEQNSLYAKGRTAPGPKVTNAKGGQSWHNFGLAFDVGCFLDGKYIDDLDDHSQKEVDAVYIAAGEIAESVGFEWGGRWKSLIDLPHMQYNPLGLTLAEVRERFDKKQDLFA